MARSGAFVPSEAGLKSRLFSALSAQSLTFISSFIESLVLLPLFIRAWGSPTYQGWVILLSAAQFLTIADLGSSYYFDNSIRMAWTAGKERSYERNVAVCLACCSILFSLACIFVIIFVSSAEFEKLFPHIHMEYATARYVFLFLAILSLVELTKVPVGAIYNARGDFARREMLFSMQTIVRVLVISLLLTLSFSPTIVAFASLAVTVSVSLIFVVIDQKARYSAMYSFALPNKEELRQLVRVSSLYFIPRSLEPVLIHVTVILLGIMGSNGLAVVTFTVARTFTGLIRAFVFAFSWIIGIELSRQHSQNAREAQGAAFRKQLSIYIHVGGIPKRICHSRGRACNKVLDQRPGAL